MITFILSTFKQSGDMFLVIAGCRTDKQWGRWSWKVLLLPGFREFNLQRLCHREVFQGPSGNHREQGHYLTKSNLPGSSCANCSGRGKLLCFSSKPLIHPCGWFQQVYFTLTFMDSLLLLANILGSSFTRDISALSIWQPTWTNWSLSQQNTSNTSSGNPTSR